MFENPEAYKHIVVGSSREALSNPIRWLFEAVREISGTLGNWFCSIVTGIAPMALLDVSGGNVWYDISLDPDFGNMFGFSKLDICHAFKSKNLSEGESECAMSTMREYYNGYRFPGSSCSFHNPTICLFFMFRYFQYVYFRNQINNLSSADFNSQELDGMLKDNNVSPSQSLFAVLCRS